MTNLHKYGCLLLLLGGFFVPIAGCDTSLNVQTTSVTPGVASSVATVPGTPDPIAEPTKLDGNQCASPSNPQITFNYYDTFGRFPVSGEPFIVFWTVCNQGQQAQPAGESYALSVEQETIDTQNGTASPQTSIASVSIPIPALAGCTCYVQEVGVNESPDPSVAQQPAIVGLNAAFPAVSVTSPPPPNLAAHTALQDDLELTSVPAGVPTPHSLTLQFN